MTEIARDNAFLAARSPREWNKYRPGIRFENMINEMLKRDNEALHYLKMAINKKTVPSK